MSEVVIKINERLDSGNVDALKKDVASNLEKSDVDLILDFSNTKFIDSIGLGTLVSILKQTAQKNVKVVLTSLSPQVRQIFELTRLYRLFDIVDSVDDAIQAMKE